jgi:hypothetical protein
MIPVYNKGRKTFYSMSRIRPVTARPAPPDLCTSVLPAVLFGSIVNSYAVCTQSRMCSTYVVYTFTTI